MFDPFPVRVAPWLANIITKLSTPIDLITLPLHIHQVLLAFTFYHVICAYISPYLSRTLFPKTYPKLNARTKLNWDVHVTSLVQSTIISAVSLWVMNVDRERANMDWRERVWGYTGGVGLLEGLGAGYFLWDVWISIVNIDLFGWGLLAHALSAFWVFALGFRPFVNFYAPSFLLYELSSPFLNIHWFCDKLSLTGSNLQLVNGIFLMGTFFGCRLVWGVSQTYLVFSDVFRALSYQETAAGRKWLSMNATTSGISGLRGGKAGQVMLYAQGRKIPWWLALTYLGSNVILTCLNVYWFGQMIKTIRSRFPPPFGTKRAEKKLEEPIVGRSIDAKGSSKSVQIEAKEVRKRKGKK